MKPNKPGLDVRRHVSRLLCTVSGSSCTCQRHRRPRAHHPLPPLFTPCHSRRTSSIAGTIGPPPATSARTRRSPVTDTIALHRLVQRFPSDPSPLLDEHVSGHKSFNSHQQPRALGSVRTRSSIGRVRHTRSSSAITDDHDGAMEGSRAEIVHARMYVCTYVFMYVSMYVSM